ncbi:MAG: AtpZ/AtpI family protein [Chloroflexi bacterium]|nr:AtpZ/AtpI family protein [Chloroflexota bacterium]
MERAAIMTRLPPTVRLTGLGFYIALCISGGVFGGVQLDGWLETGRLFAILGLFAGLAAALGGGYLLLLDVLKTNKDKKEGQ